MRSLLLSCFFVLWSCLHAQNLIPNPGFEDLKKCPKGLGQIDHTAAWSSPNKGTPDFFHACYDKDFQTVGVPNNFFSTRAAHDGRAYAGILCGTQEKEYLQVPLADPLVEGRSYCLRFRAAAPSANSDGRVAIRAYYSDGALALPTWDALQVDDPQALVKGDWQFGKVVEDWATFSQIYTAHGGETHLVIGYFAPLDFRAYTFLDAFELYESATFKGCAQGAFVQDDDIFNLVPNPGFEQYYDCPQKREDLTKAVAWRIAGNSPDFYHVCGQGTAAVPENELGTENPHSGDGYGGIWAMLRERGDYREFVKTRLKKPLEAGKQYCLSIWVSLAEDSDHALDELQLCITRSEDDNRDVQTETDTTKLVTLRNGKLLDNRDGWVFLHGTFTAKGGEEMIKIGNFRHNEDPHMRVITDEGGQPLKLLNCSYYYIDDVGLHEIGSPTCVCPGDGAVPVSIPLTVPLPLETDYQVGDTLVLRNLHFAFDKADLLPASFPQLDSLADFLRIHPDLRIRITGHTDSDGEASYNLKLSENRALSVLNYLETKQIMGLRMQSAGKGESQPAVANDSDVGKALNRRVEVEFLGQ